MWVTDQRGAVPTLAIFTIFVILVTFVAVESFQTGYRRSSQAILQRQAATTTVAMLNAVESELNDSLYSAIYAAVYESGMAGENREQVEQRTRSSLNERISSGWSYSNFSGIEVPLCDENSLSFEWQPDGSVCATGYLMARAEHMMGPRVHGVKLSVVVTPRFDRLKHVANLAYGLALLSGNLAQLELELNENYASEGIQFIIESGPRVTAQDLWAARRVILG